MRKHFDATRAVSLNCHPFTENFTMQAREFAATTTIRTLQSAEHHYYSTYGRYAASLRAMGQPTSGAASASAADLIRTDLAKGEKQGYRYTLTATPAGYTIHADPVEFSKTGARTFFSDQSELIHQHAGPEPATASDPELK